MSSQHLLQLAVALSWWTLLLGLSGQCFDGICYILATFLAPTAHCRDTGLFVPLLAAVGVASLVSEYAEGIFSEKLETALTSIYFREKLFFWGAGSDNSLATSPTSITAATTAAVAAAAGQSAAAAVAAGSSTASSTAAGMSIAVAAVVMKQRKTVEGIIATPAKLYVRHTLPLEQAKDALLARQSTAAVVVDDNFTPLGTCVYVLTLVVVYDAPANELHQLRPLACITTATACRAAFWINECTCVWQLTSPSILLLSMCRTCGCSPRGALLCQIDLVRTIRPAHL